MASEDLMAFMAGQDSGGGSRLGMDGILELAALGLIFGDGFGGGWGGGGNGGQALTRAEMYDGFAIQNIDNAVRNVQNGISDATYALTGTVTNGFNMVSQGMNNIGHQISDCCCQTGRAIDGVKYDMTAQLCALGNTVQNVARDITDNANANYRGLMDFLVGEKLASKDARIAQLEGQLGRAEQNNYFDARITAAVAELLRRTGNDCPTAAYIVQPPTPVSFPTNSCGQVSFGGCGNSCGF